MKLGVVIFHQNPFSVYKKRWIQKSLDSIINQTVKDLNFYEVDYSGSNISLLKDYNLKNYKHYSQKMTNYAEAMNFIISEAFANGCEFVFNTNIDDYYRPDRIEKQLYLIESGNYDVVSSDFCYIKEKEDPNGDYTDEVFLFMNIYKKPEDIIHHLRKDSNVIAHPSVCYSKKFWSSNKYDPTKTPQEDLDLWKKSIEKGHRFAIHPDILLYYRIHKNQVSNQNGI